MSSVIERFGSNHEPENDYGGPATNAAVFSFSASQVSSIFLSGPATFTFFEPPLPDAIDSFAAKGRLPVV